MTGLVFLFAIVFGLATDYAVLVMARIKEQHDLGKSNEEAVATGIGHTGRVITAAAACIAVVFFAFGVSSVFFMKQIAVGAGIGVLIDATIVRGLLVPSLMRLLGDWNWWAPKPLRRLQQRLRPLRGLRLCVCGRLPPVNFIEDVLERFPSARPALIEVTAEGERRVHHFGELFARSAGLSGAFAARGVRRGDVVMTLVGSRPEWVLAMLACWRMGAVALPCNPQLRRKDLELRAARRGPGAGGRRGALSGRAARRHPVHGHGRPGAGLRRGPRPGDAGCDRRTWRPGTRRRSSSPPARPASRAASSTRSAT